ncbi:MAG: 3-phosphoshikimate 1-carboxyvinyltransferase [Oscillospiraceae bacterium]|nr:3-phosphoshikimate 1-carboxyvinyltransferase [Oscillospiraceae bacterium]
MNKTIAPGPRAGEVRIPSSKSVLHRLLICAALGEKPVRIRADGISKDIGATLDCLRALGAEAETDEGGITLVPGRVTPEGEALLPCGESGSTLRFLLPLAGALGRKACFRMEGRLSERPMKVYEDLLCGRGMEIRREGCLLHCEGRLRPGDYELPGNVSSQYFSGLLMALPLLDGESRLKVRGELESAAYITLTEQALALSGVRPEALPEGGGWVIPGGQTYALPEAMDAEGDWSNAAFFLCMGALSDSPLCVDGLNLASGQGDRAILKILYDFGAKLRLEGSSVTVERFQKNPIRIDASGIPDLVPTVAVLACGAVGESRIEHAERLRLKESDRLQTTAALINGLGGCAEELPDGLVIHGTGGLKGGTADACNDHRIAMSAAVASCLCEGPVELLGADCVRKSYPAFWKEFERL